MYCIKKFLIGILLTKNKININKSEHIPPKKKYNKFCFFKFFVNKKYKTIIEINNINM